MELCRYRHLRRRTEHEEHRDQVELYREPGISLADGEHSALVRRILRLAQSSGFSNYHRQYEIPPGKGECDEAEYQNRNVLLELRFHAARTLESAGPVGKRGMLQHRVLGVVIRYRVFYCWRKTGLAPFCG